MHEKLFDIIERIQANDKEARKLGMKVSIEMIEMAYNTYVNTAKTMAEGFPESD